MASAPALIAAKNASFLPTGARISEFLIFPPLIIEQIAYNI